MHSELIISSEAAIMTDCFYVIWFSILPMIICVPDPQFRKDLKIEDISPNLSSRYQLEIANKLKELLARYVKNEKVSADKNVLKNVALAVNGYAKHLLTNKTNNDDSSNEDNNLQTHTTEKPNQIDEISAILEKMLIMNRSKTPVSKILKIVFDIIYSSFSVKSKRCMETGENLKKFVILSYNSYLEKINKCQPKSVPLELQRTEDYFMGNYRMVTNNQQMDTRRSISGYKNYGKYTLQMQPIAENSPTTFVYENINLATPKQFLLKPKLKSSTKNEENLDEDKKITNTPQVTSDHTKIEHLIKIKTFGALDACEKSAIHEFLEFTALLIRKKYREIYMACTKSSGVYEDEDDDRTFRLDGPPNMKNLLDNIRENRKVNHKFIFKNNLKISHTP